jgi:hypothetical protein
MRYIKVYDELIESRPNKINESNFSGLNHDERVALLAAAEADENWDLVKEITQELESNNGFKLNHIIENRSWISLEESVAQAKPILLDLARKEISAREKEFEMDSKGLTGEELEAARIKFESGIQSSFLNHPDYLEIRDNLAKKNPTWVGPFVKFRFLQGADIETLRQLAKLLVDFKDNLDQLPKSLEDYSNISPKSKIPGWEQLGDEFSRLAEFRKGNWIVKALPTKAVSSSAHVAAGFTPVNLREEYKNASPEKQRELILAAAALSNLNKPTLIKAVTQNLSGRPSLDDVITFINRQVENASNDMGKMLEVAWAAWPAVAVLYEGEKHIVVSFRNDAKLPELCAGASGWCIQPAWYNPGWADRFWSYATGSLQLGILDFSVNSDSPFRTVGVTIAADGKVSDLCDQSNRCLSRLTKFDSVLAGFKTDSGMHGYPKELIDAIVLNFNQEVKLKTSTDNLYKKIKSYSEGTKDRSQALSKTLIGMIRNLGELTSDSSLSSTDFSSTGSESMSKQIVAHEIEKLKDSPEMEKVRDEYISKAKLGLGSPADVKLFEIVMDGSPKLSETLINAIITRNIAVNQVLTKNLAAAPASQKATPGFKRIELLKTGLDDSVIQLRALLQKIKS